jgi:Rod binding domain-containing protein
MTDAMTGVPAAFSAATTVAAMRPAPTVARSADPAAIRKTATKFEAFFIGQMLEQMFKGVPVDGFFGGGQSEGIWRSMLLQQYGRAIAERGGFGVADMVSREMLKLQEAR